MDISDNKMYGAVQKLQTLYPLLCDELSREIFWARLACDVAPAEENEKRLGSLCQYDTSRPMEPQARKVGGLFQKVECQQKKLVIYGTRDSAQKMAACFEELHIPLHGFCGRGAAKFPDGLMGKPVLPPEDLFQRADECYVVIAAAFKADEIKAVLRENHFPESHILHCYEPVMTEAEKIQYFEFPDLYPSGTAFLDCGCYRCETSYNFAERFQDRYGRILAFEPDPDNIEMCTNKLKDRGIRDFQLVQAGLSDVPGTLQFQGGEWGRSCLLGFGYPFMEVKRDKIIPVPVTTIDTVCRERETGRVGFIKMDIEGAEFDALQGARETLLQDKPLLAISVYHRFGDMLAILEYLHDLVPAYHFWLRHYNDMNSNFPVADTVLYASVDTLE